MTCCNRKRILHKTWWSHRLYRRRDLALPIVSRGCRRRIKANGNIRLLHRLATKLQLLRRRPRRRMDLREDPWLPTELGEQSLAHRAASRHSKISVLVLLETLLYNNNQILFKETTFSHAPRRTSQWLFAFGLSSTTSLHPKNPSNCLLFSWNFSSQI